MTHAPNRTIEYRGHTVTFEADGPCGSEWWVVAAPDGMFVGGWPTLAEAEAQVDAELNGAD